jgi:hypothetical protein
MKLVQGFFFEGEEYTPVYDNNNTKIFVNEQSNIMMICNSYLEIKKRVFASCGQNMGFFEMEDEK